ncbi:membrane protein insertion efficiency factor YidD [Amnibacterium endophyticum]|uniref:Putative membrane protein insertion efficiency factor n=1 Tax=Amnibacterium endophyticum TaxID=2109337 RepID=A0ABW4LB45_9MICO
MTAVLLLPRNLLIAALLAYRRLVSPLYGQVCRYHPSCSRYALEAVQQSGAAVGTALAAWRVLRCNPWSRGGVDDPPARLNPAYRITPLGFVRPAEQPGG